MSIRAMQWAWRQSTLSPSERLVLLALCDHAGEDGECWPTTGRLAEKCGLSKQSVQRHLTALADRRLIEKVERRKRADGGLGGWLYRVVFDDRVIVDDVSPWHSRGVTDDESREVSPVIPLRHVTDDESYTEPSVEPSEESSLVVEVVDEFEMFWARYPRRVAKPAAVRAWSKLSREDRVHVLDSIDAQVDYWARTVTDMRFIPHPATWLNQRRFDDELPTEMHNKPAPGMAMVRRLLNEVRDD